VRPVACHACTWPTFGPGWFSETSKLLLVPLRDATVCADFPPPPMCLVLPSAQTCLFVMNTLLRATHPRVLSNPVLLPVQYNNKPRQGHPEGWGLWAVATPNSFAEMYNTYIMKAPLSLLVGSFGPRAVSERFAFWLAAERFVLCPRVTL